MPENLYKGLLPNNLIEINLKVKEMDETMIK
jgi:hypothetical protein